MPSYYSGRMLTTHTEATTPAQAHHARVQQMLTNLDAAYRAAANS